MRFVADENFNGRILERLCQRFKDLDIVRIQDTDFYGAPDPAVLDWAAQEERIILTHDVQTLVNDAYEMEDMNLGAPEDTPFTIDPAVLVDDDGQAYLYYGGFGTMIVAPLNDDMISLSGPLQRSTPQGFFEAPFVFKREGVYYNVYAAGVNPAALIALIASSTPIMSQISKGPASRPNPHRMASSIGFAVSDISGMRSDAYAKLW